MTMLGGEGCEDWVEDGQEVFLCVLSRLEAAIKRLLCGCAL